MEPFNIGATIRGITPFNSVYSKALEDSLGPPLEIYYNVKKPRYFGQYYIYEGPILIETYGSDGAIDCIYADELQVKLSKDSSGQVLRRGDSSEKVRSLLGEAHASAPDAPVDHYRKIGNIRLAVWYESEKKQAVDHFIYYSGIGGRQRGWGWGSGSPFVEIRAAFQ